MRSHYWDEIKYWITKHFSDVLISYQWEIEFCSCGSKIRDLIWNLQQNDLSFCDTINMCTINLAPRVSLLSDKEEGTFLHIKKSTCPGKKFYILLQHENWIMVTSISFTHQATVCWYLVHCQMHAILLFDANFTMCNLIIN